MGYTENFEQNREPIERVKESSDENRSAQSATLPKLKRSEKTEAFRSLPFYKEQLEKYQNELREDYLSYRIMVNELSEDEDHPTSEEEVSGLYQGLTILELNAEFLEEKIDELRAKIRQVENTSPPLGMIGIVVAVTGVAIVFAVISQVIFTRGFN